MLDSEELHNLQALLDNVEVIPDMALDDWTAWLDRYLESAQGAHDASLGMAVQTILSYKR